VGFTAHEVKMMNEVALESFTLYDVYRSLRLTHNLTSEIGSHIEYSIPSDNIIVLE